MVRAYQIQLDPERMQIYGVSVQEVIEAVQEANDEAGGAVIDRAEAEYMATVGGYLEDLDEFRSIPLPVRVGGGKVTDSAVARWQVGPYLRGSLAQHTSGREGGGGVTAGVRQGNQRVVY